MSLKLRLLLDRPGQPGAREGFRLDVDLAVPDRGVTALFGPSGSGKTTLLRCVAGLEPRARGTVRIGRHVWQDEKVFLPAWRRRAGYVFQEGALFPHLDVAGNLAYGLKRRTRPGVTLKEVSALLGLTPLLGRAVAGLSGGERQRVALGRALLAGPDLLLLDEPLAALDRGSRRAIYPYLERIGAESDIPFLYVTHALDEAARLADHLVLMDQGRSVRSGPLTTMLTEPPPGLAAGEEAGCVVFATIDGVDEAYHLARLAFPGGTLLVPDPGQPIGRPLRVRIHARDVSLVLAAPSDSSILNILPGRVLDLAAAGPARVMVRLAVGETVILAAVTQRSAANLDLKPGKEVFAQVKSVALL